MQHIKPQDMHRNLLFVLFFCTTSFLSIAQESLEYKLKVGEQFVLVQESNQNISQVLEGATYITTNEISGMYSMEVIQKTESGYILEFSFDHFTMKTESDAGGTLIDVDTNREVDEADIQARIFKGLVGVPMQMELLKTGRVLKITGADKLINNMIASSGVTDQYTQQQMYNAMEAEFGSNKLAASFEQLTYIYPESPVKLDDSWENQINGALKATNTWKYLEANSTGIVIAGVSSISMDTDTNGTKMKLSGEQSTRVQCDANTGLILKFESDSKLSGNSFVAMMGDTPIPTTIETKTRYYKK